MDESATSYISTSIRSIPGLQSATGVVWRSKRKKKDQDLNSPCLTRKTAQVLGSWAGLGPRPIKSDTKTWYIRIYGILTGAKYEKPWGAWPETYPRLNRAIFPNHH